MSDGLLKLLGLDDGLGGTWLDSGEYFDDCPVDFSTRTVLRVHLDQINSTGNYVDGAPSTLLATVGLGKHSFGDIETVRYSHPDYRRLRGGCVSELKLTIRDESGAILDNHGLPIHTTLVVDNQYV